MFSKKIRSFFAVITLAMASAMPTQSHAVTNALYLAIDGSGSIGASDFSLQINGYVNALNSVFGTGNYWGTAVGVSVFSSSVTEQFAIRQINDATDLADLTSAIAATPYPRGWTAIGDAIFAAASAIEAAFSSAKNKVIDVSTDGVSNTGAHPVTAANSAFNDYGIKTNCIGIGGSANCSFATGFSVQVNNYAGFEKALVSKLQRELKPTPAPAVVMLLALGLVAMGVARRRA